MSTFAGPHTSNYHPGALAAGVASLNWDAVKREAGAFQSMKPVRHCPRNGRWEAGRNRATARRRGKARPGPNTPTSPETGLRPMQPNRGGRSGAVPGPAGRAAALQPYHLQSGPPGQHPPLLADDLRERTLKTNRQPDPGTSPLVVIVLTVLCAMSVVHAESATTLDPVVVTATRIPTPMREIGASVTMVDREDMERRQVRTVGDALRTVPGLRVVRSGGAGQQTSVFVRGANSNQTLVLLDGVRLSDPSSPSGAVDFANLLVENLDRIEVVRGPLGTLYGSDAIGGVINLITRRGEGPPKASGSLEGGSDNTFNQRVGLNGASGAFDYSLGGIHVNTHGDSATPRRLRDGARAEDDAYENWTASSRLGWSASDALELSLVGRYVKGETEIDPEIEDNFGFGTTEDRDAKLEQRQYSLRGQADADLADGLWHSQFAVSFSDFDRDSRNDRDEPGTETFDRTSFEGWRLKFEWKNDFYWWDDHILTAGAETEKEDSRSDGVTEFGRFPIYRQTDADARNSAIYLQDQFSFMDRLFGTVGARVDHHDEFGSEATYRLSGAYEHPDTATRLTGSVGTGFKAPSLEQLYGFAPTGFGTAYRGNPDLDPEQSFGWELGFEQPLWQRRVALGATYFRNNVDDLIEVVFLPSFDSTSVNVQSADLDGVEAFAALRATDRLGLRLDYTYTDAEDNDGQRLLRRPRHKLSLEANLELFAGLGLYVGGERIGETRDIDRVSGRPVDKDGYTLWNTALNYRFGPDLTAYLRVDNFTDRNHEPADGFKGPGRGFLSGFQVEFP